MKLFLTSNLNHYIKVNGEKQVLYGAGIYCQMAI